VYDRGNNTLLVNLHVLDAPPYSIHSNAVPRDQIVAMLMDQVNSRQVNITLGDVTITPSIRIRPNNTCPNLSNMQPSATMTSTIRSSTNLQLSATMASTIRLSPTCAKEEESNGLDTGPAVVLAIGMLLIGVIIGLVSAFLIMWIIRRGKSASYKASTYSRQKDEAVI